MNKKANTVCIECGHEMKLKYEDVWGKIVRCTSCTAVILNGLHLPPPKYPTEAERRRKLKLGVPFISRRELLETARALSDRDDEMQAYDD